MRKQDYLTLAHTLRSDIADLNKQREIQLAIGIKNIRAPIDSPEFGAAYDAIKTLEQRINYIKLLAHGLSMKLAVDRKAFLSECGIYSETI